MSSTGCRSAILGPVPNAHDTRTAPPPCHPGSRGQRQPQPDRQRSTGEALSGPGARIASPIRRALANRIPEARDLFSRRCGHDVTVGELEPGAANVDPTETALQLRRLPGRRARLHRLYAPAGGGLRQGRPRLHGVNRGRIVLPNQGSIPSTSSHTAAHSASAPPRGGRRRSPAIQTRISGDRFRADVPGPQRGRQADRPRSPTRSDIRPPAGDRHPGP